MVFVHSEIQQNQDVEVGMSQLHKRLPPPPRGQISRTSSQVHGRVRGFCVRVCLQAREADTYVRICRCCPHSFQQSTLCTWCLQRCTRCSWSPVSQIGCTACTGGREPWCRSGSRKRWGRCTSCTLCDWACVIACCQDNMGEGACASNGVGNVRVCVCE